MPSIPPTIRAGTPDLPAVPPLVQCMIGIFLAPILAWVEVLVMRRVLRACAAHPLVRLAQWYDPTPVVQACAAYRHPAGTPGAPPTFSLDPLVRAEIVRAWADSCSDPDLEFLLATNLLVRWFVGLPLVGPTPDHTTLHRFHAWITIHAPDALFRAVLRFVDQIDPEDPATTPQIVDTFAMESPAAATPSTAHLLRHLALRLVRDWQAHAPPALQTVLAEVDVAQLVRPVHARTAAARQGHLQAAITVTRTLVATLTPHLPALGPPFRTVVTRYLEALAKVEADDVETDSDGVVRERSPKTRGSQRIVSAVDTEATFRKHEGRPAVLGTNAVISTTVTRIRAVVALTGSTPDSEAPCAALAQQRAANDALPPFLLMDQAGGWGKTRARVHALSDGQTQMVAWIPASGGSDRTRFTVADFRVDPAHGTCTCPNGVVSRTVYRSGAGDGEHYRFLASHCQGCPVWNQCRDAEAKPNGHRSVFISDYHAFLRTGAEFNQSPEGMALLQRRWQVEPVIAWLVRYHGCRRARRVGHAAAQVQLYQASAVRNLLLWLARVQRKAAPCPPG
ncbi:transposase [Candidatus Oscillochloris fontis]|uniref:transposase n=1 Tax=Candidatus Oscillochloris fontis TaxID=2496868 RepID=UPI00101C9380|nr:transposase [Candidatus Oscillochloris fontis]